MPELSTEVGCTTNIEQDIEVTSHKIICQSNMNCKYLAFLVLSGASSIALNSRYAKAANDMKEYEVQTILQKMESYVLAFRDELERVYSARCDTKTLTDCAESNFNDCSSTFPGQQCMEAEELVIGRCGDGISCNGKCTKHHYLVFPFQWPLITQSSTSQTSSTMGQETLHSQLPSCASSSSIIQPN